MSAAKTKSVVTLDWTTLYGRNTEPTTSRSSSPASRRPTREETGRWTPRLTATQTRSSPDNKTFSPVRGDTWMLD
ncbi:hypothetical protein SKAU_G00376740 [Synaphobranchus kaupii]|uniref:Uncharacterized protein n=1 Tax=Synaphobranchus kaupii TaxID=118154 RepID=A0A9Q1ECU8_SYNKA|nr:hypothetical protein SKAU_G00376740 [Synaphobranchus kaupii]